MKSVCRKTLCASLSFVAICLVNVCPAQAATFCVSNETELQDALTTAASNGEDNSIQIVQGTYNGNFTYASYESNSLTLEGGYTSDCTTRTIDPENTVLDGGGVDHVLALVTSDAEADFSVEGLTLRNGSASTAPNGGGLYAKTEGNVTLTNNLISENMATDGSGGGVFISASSAIVTNNTFRGNAATNGNGAGAYLKPSEGGSVSLTENTLTGNTVQHGGGGGAYIDLGSLISEAVATVANNVFTENSAIEGSGGGVHLGGPLRRGTLTNNVFRSNSAYTKGPGFESAGWGGGVFGGETISDNIFTGNSASGYGGGIFQGGTLTNNTFLENSASQGGGGASSCGTATDNIFEGNTAGCGGGIHGSGVSTTNIFTGNTATDGNGGGAFHSSGGYHTKDVFTGNRAPNGDGGGLYAKGSSVTLTGVVFNGNVAANGGGIYVEVTQPYRGTPAVTLMNAIFTANTAGSGSGGGIYLYAPFGHATLANSAFSKNISTDKGGGVYTEGIDIAVVNNTLCQNGSETKGGGISLKYTSKEGSGNIYNNIMWNNTASEASDLSIDNTGDDPFFPVKVNLFDNDFNQAASGTYISKPFTIDSSNLNKIDPMFVGSGNYHLSSSSPCIDTGNNDAPGLPESDKDGNPRIVNSIVDMGAYEYNPEGPTANAGPDQTVSAGTVVTLDGSHSSDPKGATLTYLWSQTGGTAVALSDSAAARPTFTAPEKASLLMFELRVTNPSGLNNTDGVNITVNQTIPSVTTTEVSDITSSTASSGGNVTSEGGSSVTARGVCWSTSANPSTSDSHTSDGSGTGTFTSSITGLNSGMTYHVRAYATNGSGTAYGSDKSFMTNASAPTVNTGTATSVTSTSATLNGAINPNGASTTYYFEYGTTTAYGLKTAITSAGSGTTEVAVTANITGLTAETTYHFRLVATNSEGAASGNDRTFITSTTPPLSPSVTTGSAAYLTSTSVILYGQVNPNGSDTEVYFEYGPTTDYGFATPTEDIGSGSKSVSVSATVTDLTSDTAYHYRIVATNSAGTSLGADKLLYQDLLYVSPDGTCGGKTPCFSTIQGAIDFALSCALVRICEGAFDEDVMVDHTYGVVLSGGWDSTFAVQESETVIHSLAIGETGGPVETDNIVLQ